MKKMTALILTYLLPAALYAQPGTDKTQLTIIGTIHNGNSYFNYKTLFRKLEELKPDIILYEQSEPFRRVFGLQTAAFLGIWKPGIEQRALQKYTRKNKSVIVLSCDTLIPFRKKYAASIINNGNKLHIQLDNAANSSQIEYTDSIGYADYTMKRNDLFSFITDTTLERINQPDVIEKTKELYAGYSQQLLKWVNTYIKDTALADWYRYENNFWVLRNNYMAKQIIKVAEQNKGKKIIVLTGLAHHYFLLEKIINQAENTIAIKPLL